MESTEAEFIGVSRVVVRKGGGEDSEEIGQSLASVWWDV